MATLTFTLVLDGIEEDTLVVREYQGHESLSDTLLQDGSPCYGFRYQLSLASRRSDLSADHIVDKHAELRIVRNGLLVQRVHGIVRHFEKGDTGHHHTYYALSLVPALERLALRHNSRIFQKKSAEDILTQLLEEMGITDYRFILQRTPQQREFCVQYRETDLHFLHRLAAEEGWVYYFTNETMALSEEGTYLKGKHTLNIVDKSQSMPKHDRAIPYNVLSGGVDNTPYISTLTEHTQSFPSQSVLKDYSFKKPDYRFLHQQEGHDMDYQHQAYEHFDSPGRFKDDNTGKAFARIRLEYLRRTAHTVVGKSNDAVIQAGTRITVTDHIDDKMNQVWVPVQVTHQGNQPQALEEEGHTGATTYHNTFTLIPTATNWQATPQPKPNVDGPMMATVVGPQDEEIYCDDHGRVKIHFPWDRYSAANDQSSCWIRVSQGWAGNQHGMMAIPRIGSEVIVSFLNGDPDQPIVTGRTYHAKNTPPYVLPEHKTKTVWRSDTHQGKGFNEISFEDQVDHEKVYLHAQKDQQEDILNDQLTQIGHDQHVNIGNDRFTEIKKDNHLTIEGECRLKVFKNKTDLIDGSLQQKVGSKAILDAAQEIHLKSGSKTVIEAASEMTIKVGTNFIKIDAAGVHIVGSAINLNTGGSPGSGSGFSGIAAALPLGATSPEYDADLEAIEGNDAPDSPLAGMTASAAPTTASDKKSDEVEENTEEEESEKEQPFEAGYLINDKTTTRQQLYYDHVSDKNVFHLAFQFNKNNAHLTPDNVLPGEIVILASKPKTEEEEKKLTLLKEQAKLASEGVQQLTEEEAQTAYHHFLLLNYLNKDGIGEGTAGVGFASAAMAQRFDNLKSVLEKLNKNYLDHTQVGLGGKASFTPTFYENRKVLFGQLDNTLERLTMSKINIGDHPNIKHTLGLSSKSIIHNWDTVAATGEVPELGKRINQAAKMAKGASAVGWLAVGVDGLIAADNIKEACTGDDISQCEVVSYKEVGGLTGSATLGAIGAKVGSAVATGVATGIAVFLGVTIGGVAIIAIGFIGAGVGAYGASQGGGAFGEFIGESIYQYKKGGF
ncbi:type VI secretion system Vgr family protein [Marinomonas primoryensis]|uniref:type VI secretion system Vgr family protein n=1 Tax=Marinomonas primoryensis TaxID=178399 RepID=UPI000DD2F726|nr:type VI secretion system tip protein TssI/VgrG [Marinomonas primoryensis]